MLEEQQIVDQIREFNRFYTVLQGFLSRNYLDSGYSVTETRILFELKRNPQMSASLLIKMLRLDKSYVSRLIRGFEHKQLITRHPSPDDLRELVIQLTSLGHAEANRLIEITNQKIAGLIEPLSDPSREKLYHSMQTIIEIFHSNMNWQEEPYGNKR